MILEWDRFFAGSQHNRDVCEMWSWTIIMCVSDHVPVFTWLNKTWTSTWQTLTRIIMIPTHSYHFNTQQHCTLKLAADIARIRSYIYNPWIELGIIGSLLFMLKSRNMQKTCQKTLQKYSKPTYDILLAMEFHFFSFASFIVHWCRVIFGSSA